MSDVELGGSTVFVNAGAAVKPRKVAFNFLHKNKLRSVRNTPVDKSVHQFGLGSLDWVGFFFLGGGVKNWEMFTLAIIFVSDIFVNLIYFRLTLLFLL